MLRTMREQAATHTNRSLHNPNDDPDLATRRPKRRYPTVVIKEEIDGPQAVIPQTPTNDQTDKCNQEDADCELLSPVEFCLEELRRADSVDE